jgi:hypothetical protein
MRIFRTASFLSLFFLICCAPPQHHPSQNALHLNFKSYKKLTYHLSSYFHTEFQSGEKLPEIKQMQATGTIVVVPQNDSLATVTCMVFEGTVFESKESGFTHTEKMDTGTDFVLKNLRTNGRFANQVDTLNSIGFGYATYLFYLPKSTQTIGEIEADPIGYQWQTAIKPIVLTGPRQVALKEKHLSGKDTIYTIQSGVNLKMSRIDSLLVPGTEAIHKYDGLSEFNSSKGYFQKGTFNIKMLFNSPSKPDPRNQNKTHLVKAYVICKVEYNLVKVE